MKLPRGKGGRRGGGGKEGRRGREEGREGGKEGGRRKRMKRIRRRGEEQDKQKKWVVRGCEWGALDNLWDSYLSLSAVRPILQHGKALLSECLDLPPLDYNQMPSPAKIAKGQ